MSLDLGISAAFFINEGITPKKIGTLQNSRVKSVELCWHFKFINYSKEMTLEYARALKDTGIACHAFHAPFGESCNPASLDEKVRQSTKEILKESIEYLQILNGRHLVLHPSFGSIEDPLHEEHLKAAEECLAWLGTECGRVGVVPAIENLYKAQLGNSAAELDRLIEATGLDGAGLCLDIAHATLAEGPEQLIRDLKNPVTTLHLCDNTNHEIERTCWPLQPQGLSNWNSIMKALKNKDYKGPLMYEVYNNAAPNPDRSPLMQLEENYLKLLRIYENTPKPYNQPPSQKSHKRSSQS